MSAVMDPRFADFLTRAAVRKLVELALAAKDERAIQGVMEVAFSAGVVAGIKEADELINQRTQARSA